MTLLTASVSNRQGQRQAQPYGHTFAAWRNGCPDPWHAYTHHSFVEGLRTGALPRSAYLHYLIQDYVFLVHFSRAWSLGVVKAETQLEMKTCARTVDALVNHEMALHIGTCAAEGIDEATLFNASEEFENLAYTRYVTDAGLQGDFLDLMAALAPCCFGYGEIGTRLAASAASDTPYNDWINTYAGEDYQSVMVEIGRMMDDAVARRLGDDPQNVPRWSRLQHRFTTATRLEVGFWDMGMRAS
ncbi:aminopyrimidine aminohydrolase [Tateyamaria omphalii]|uniref:TenA family protein n=1 Tax=Tateyamaria omphalii TaxID=299262 RepID=UPI00167B35BD|nr:TenA family protein [Tateyamaria omphalii]GGX64005.1 aminopyrimidine aminohydrolase [Tateyamaria omphalii]